MDLVINDPIYLYCMQWYRPTTLGGMHGAMTTVDNLDEAELEAPLKTRILK
jgi:hypothetical protein